LDNWREDKNIASARCGRLDMMSVYVTKHAGDSGFGLVLLLALREPGLYRDSIKTEWPQTEW
jgi:hypothetical protein